jgi:hypothetical protein
MACPLFLVLASKTPSISRRLTSPETKGGNLPRYHSALQPSEAAHSNRCNGRIPKRCIHRQRCTHRKRCTHRRTHGRPSEASAGEGSQPVAPLLCQLAAPYSSQSQSVHMLTGIVSCRAAGVKQRTRFAAEMCSAALARTACRIGMEYNGRRAAPKGGQGSGGVHGR